MHNYLFLCRFVMVKPAKNSIGVDAYFEHYYFQVNEQKYVTSVF